MNMKEIKELLGEYVLEGGLMIFSILLLVIFLKFPSYQGNFWLTIQPFLHMFILITAIIFFSIGLILWIKHFEKIKTPRKYRMQSGLRKKFLRNNNCDVFYAGTKSVYDYSTYAKWLQENSNPSEIFTICAFEPCDILNFVLPRYNELQRTQCSAIFAKIERLHNISDKNFLSLVDNIFPHFQHYKEFYKNGGNIMRVLLLKDENAKKRNPAWMFEKFKLLNADIPCNVAYRNILEQQNIAFLTDFVVYDNKFIIDYYSDSNAFILSSLRKKDDPLQHLIKLVNHYKKNRNDETCYTPLNDFITSI